MRVTGTHRKSEKRKVEGPRIAGIGLMMIGALALVLSVAGAAGAGSTTKAADPAHHTCGTVNTEDGPMAQVLQSVQYGNCGWDTTTTTMHHCGCSTTTEAPTTEAPTTMVEGTTVDVTTVPATTATTTPATTATTAPATTATTMPATTQPTSAPGIVPGGGGTTTSLGVKGISVQSSPTSLAVEPTSEVLPFTGSNTTPLAIAGFVMLAAGFGLTRTRTKRRLAR
jgi:LPXTG-motif cell wall-anchored protein